MKSENPFDILNCFRANGSSFHVKAVFSPETGNEKEGKPMAAFNHFSRLVITIIDNDNVRFVDANIQYELLAEIIGRGRYALEKVYKREFEPVATDGEKSSPAYTVVIPTGKLKGKTPADALLNTAEGLKLLTEHYNWLKDNVGKYPKNKEQMDAIVEAVGLMKAGKLKATSSSASVFKILEAVPKPLIRKKDEKTGTCPVKEIQIECNLTKNAPFEIFISNYDAPVKGVSRDGLVDITAEGSNGNKVNVQKKEQENEVHKKFNLTVGEFEQLLDHIEIAKKIFLNTYSSQLFKEAVEAEAENRKNI